MALYGYCGRCDREPRRVGGVLPQMHVVGDTVYCHDCVGLSMAQKGMKAFTPDANAREFDNDGFSRGWLVRHFPEEIERRASAGF